VLKKIMQNEDYNFGTVAFWESFVFGNPEPVKWSPVKINAFLDWQSCHLKSLKLPFKTKFNRKTGEIQYFQNAAGALVADGIDGFMASMKAHEKNTAAAKRPIFKSSLPPKGYSQNL
jgi:hypothetical protein